MSGFLRQLGDSISTLFKRYPAERRTSMIFVMLLLVGAVTALLIWAFKPQYRMLYSDLSLVDSGKITEILISENIPYKLEAEGRRILVPVDDVYNSRLKMAAQELPKNKGTGWELFDKTSLGVTDFVQKLNYRRGLEGELARTILQLEPVEAVRVHLAIPEESLFRETQQLPTASVTLRLNRGQRLSNAQVEGITYLVGSAVEGLRFEEVTVIDNRGYVLSEQKEADPLMRLTANQLELQNQVEARLVAKGQSFLDKRFGPDRSTIQVTAKLDFRKEERTREIFDADNPSIRSEEITATNSMGSDTSSNTNESSITNYELNLTKESYSSPVGGIERMTIAVMVDGNYIDKIDEETGESAREFVSLDRPEIEEITNTIKLALGFDTSRNDEITIVSVPFQEVEMYGIEELSEMNQWDNYIRYGQKLMTLIAVILLLVMVRNFVRKAEETAVEKFGFDTSGRQLISGSQAENDVVLALPELEASIRAEAKAESLLKEQVSDFTVENPEMAAQLIRSWLNN
ncbi:MAG: flagellar M-ring protein FliF [Calditrichaeota bacterium]|nr:flagellar M-ring protein FliF [Calditrichota bacterium]